MMYNDTDTDIDYDENGWIRITNIIGDIEPIPDEQKVVEKENIREVTIPNGKTFVPPHKQKRNRIRNHR